MDSLNYNIDQLSGEVFGNYEILGWVGKQGYNKVYLFRCSVCSEDFELFGEGLFKTNLENIKKAKPCGCSKSYNWSKEQYEILCTRSAQDRGLIFLGFAEDFHGATTKISLICDKHGQWETSSINNFRSKETGCPSCKIEGLAKNSMKSDEIMISSFFASGSFVEGTLFRRSGTANARGHKVYWECFCPACNESYTSHFDELKKGRKQCSCKGWKPSFLYINLLEDGDLPVALKFGITNNIERRNKEQSTFSQYTIRNLCLFEFENSIDCKEAEKHMKKSLSCGVVPRYLMEDGWTETTELLNFDFITNACEDFGGVRL